jgi:hypothetical protein
MIRNTAESCGQALIEAELKSYANEIPTENKIKTENLYCQIDGSMVPIISGEQDEPKIGSLIYKECKLGIFYRQEDIIKTFTQKNRNKPNQKITAKQFVSSIGRGVKDFEQKWIAKAKTYSVKEEQMVFLSDGAIWIDNMITRNFPKAIHILDWYHAVEHIWGCAKELFDENETVKQEKFVKPLKELMWEGKIDELCNEILKNITKDIKKNKNKETKLRELYSYFNTRKEQMRYAFFREKGYNIGSGTIESANKYLAQKRLKGAGMKWTIEGAEAILKIREKLYENSWNRICGNKNLNFSY